MSGDDELDPRSRSDVSKERKADEKRLAALATALVGLSSKQLSRLTLDEAVLDAVDEARRMTQRSARARQLRIVRRELRASDNVAIAEAVDDLLNPSGRPTLAAREAQRWIERFLEEGHEALEAFLADHAEGDRQRLRGLIRNLQKTAQKADAKKVAKARKTLSEAIQDVFRQHAIRQDAPGQDEL